MKRFAVTVPVVLVVLLGFASAAATQPTPRVARIGMLCAPLCNTVPNDAFLDELRKLGWVEGTTIVIERKDPDYRLDRLPALAADLVRSKPNLIVAFSPPPARAAKEATSDIPIVMLFVADPVGAGLASSLAYPGGNLTGVAGVPGGSSTGRSLVFFERLCHRRSAWQFSSTLQTRCIGCYFRRYHLRPLSSAFSSTFSRCAKRGMPGAIAAAKAGVQRLWTYFLTRSFPTRRTGCPISRHRQAYRRSPSLAALRKRAD